MGQPSNSTVKRLFAVSGNRCAFPGCRAPLVDFASGKTVGEICHIKANRPGGPRYDSAQSEEERQSYENLIVLCPVHHSVIDADAKSYTVERLHEMKAEHESNQPRQPDLSTELAERLIAGVNIGSMTDGSVILSMNQTGGQIAHKITNVGYQPKQIPEPAIPEFLDLMRSVGPAKVHVTANMLDPQTQFLANQLTHLLQKAGWDASGESMSLYGPDTPQGIVFIGPKSLRESLWLNILTKCLKAYGFTNYLIINEEQKLPTIAVIKV